MKQLRGFVLLVFFITLSIAWADKSLTKEKPEELVQLGRSENVERYKRRVGVRIPYNYGENEKQSVFRERANSRGMKRFRTGGEYAPSTPSYRSFQTQHNVEDNWTGDYDEDALVPRFPQVLPLVQNSNLRRSYNNLEMGNPVVSNFGVSASQPRSQLNEEEELSMLLRNYPSYTTGNDELLYPSYYYPLANEDFKKAGALYSNLKSNIGENSGMENMAFLGARKKRIGARNFMKTTVEKREAGDTEVQEKSKKDVDWSRYFGIDKRNSEDTSQISEEKPSSPAISPSVKEKKASSMKKDIKPETTLAEEGSKPLMIKGSIQEDLEGKNSLPSKPDRKWALHELYKNLAMSTNVKRKREADDANASISEMEVESLGDKMREAGDQIIWDTLKFAGAHRDEEMTPQQLAEVKSYIISRLTQAYSFEKLRQDLEEIAQSMGSETGSN